MMSFFKETEEPKSHPAYLWGIQGTSYKVLQAGHPTGLSRNKVSLPPPTPPWHQLVEKTYRQNGHLRVLVSRAISSRAPLQNKNKAHKTYVMGDVGNIRWRRDERLRN